MARIVLLMGPTGAGKSELAGSLVKTTGFRHLSSGRILRENLADHPQMLHGKLVTSAEVEHIIDAAVVAVLEHSDQIKAPITVLLDGFPRTLDQADWLDSRLSDWGASLWRVLHLDVDLATSQQRLAGRGRADDAPAAIAEKWHEYERVTRPVIEWYERAGSLRHIDANGTPDDVYNAVMQELSR